MERQLNTADLLLSGEPGGGLDVGAVAAPFRGDGPKAYVPVIVDVDGEDLLAARDGDKVSCVIYVYALNDKGDIADWLAQPLALDLTKLEPKLHAEPLRFAGDLMLPPGDYHLRLLVRAGARGTYGLRDLPIEVPAYDSGRIAVTPAIFPAPSSGLFIRGKARTTTPFPFTWNNAAFVPIGLPAAPAQGEAQAIAVVSGVASGAIEVSGDLLDAAGKPVEGSSIAMTASEPAGEAAARLELIVRSGSAAPGDYTLRLRVSQAGKAAQSETALRVTG